MLISIINIFFIMNSNELLFNNKLEEVIDLIDIKGNKFEYTLKHSSLSCTIYKTINKKTVELPTTNMINENEPKENLNQYFFNVMKLILLNHYAVFFPIITSINFKLVLEVAPNREIMNVYYKTAFFTGNKNTIVRISPTLDKTIYNQTNSSLLDIEQSKHDVVKKLFGLKLDPDFVFDKNGINLIEMLLF